jgi:hypothetical protein
MASSTNQQFYRDRAEEARLGAEAATLSHVRDRCRRSEAAWTELANRAAATNEQRLKLVILKAANPPSENEENL